jgi:hypothetical protein
MAASIRAECALNGRGFAIGQTDASNYFYEVKADGSQIFYGALPGDRRPQIVPGNTQLLILAGGLGYSFDLATSTLARITDPNFPIGAVKGGFLNGQFLVLEPNSQTFAFSAVNDCTSWNGLDFADVEGEPGNVVTFVVDHLQLFFFANTHTEIFVNSGNALTPFQRFNGAFMEQGAAGLDVAFQCDNTIFWLGGNRDGQGIFWRANGYSPERVSTFAIEHMVQKYWGDLSNVSGYCYQEDGHTYARWDSPTAYNGLGATLLFDVASGFWHERYFWNGVTGQYLADLARCHMYVFGKHLVGDYRSGTIYEQSTAFKTDCGAAIRRVRTSPDLANGGKWIFYGEMRLLMEVGTGLDGASGEDETHMPSGGVSAGNGSNPVITVQLSNDGGRTWGRERTVTVGQKGNYRRLVRWQQNGRSNNRCLRVICTEPVNAGLISLDMDTVAGT